MITIKHGSIFDSRAQVLVWPLYERHLGALDSDVEVWIWP